MFVSLNGKLIDEHLAQIPAQDRGFLLGDGLFETLRVKDGRVLNVPAHLARLRGGAQMLGFPTETENLEQEIERTVTANQVTTGVVRLTVSRGEGQRGIMPPDHAIPTVLITATSLAVPQTPITAYVVQFIRRNQHSPLFQFKTLNYLDNILARQEAERQGYGDAILLNTDRMVAETSIGNLLVKLDGQWLTPPVRDGAMPGTARAKLLGAGLVSQQSLTEADLHAAQSVMLVNVLALRAFTRIDDTQFDLPSDEEDRAFRDCLDL